MSRPADSSDLERLGGHLRQEMSAMGSDLRQEISAMGSDLRQDMSAMGSDLRQDISATAAGLRQEIHATGEQIRAGLRQEIQASGEQIRAELRHEIQASVAVVLARIDASAAETRRYMGVVAEDLKSDIKAVAEGLGALDEKVDRFRGEVHHEFATVDRRMLHLEVRVIGRSGPA
jgi:F0F1-type ATP synthase membrane subunit b/b'